MLSRILLIIPIISLVEFYFFRKLSKAVKYLFPDLNTRKYKISVGVVLSFLNLYPVALLINWILGIVLENPAPIALQGPFYNYFLIFPFWIGILIVVQSVLFILLLDIIRIISRFLTGKNKIVQKAEAIVIFIIIGLAVLYVPTRIYYDYHYVSFKEAIIVQDNLNKDLEEFRLVFISDIQADSFTDNDRLQRYIDAANNANPHMVLLAGDFITSGPKFVELAAAFAGKLKAEMGVYSCIGDHDHWIYRDDHKRSLRELSSALAKQNVNLIHNKNIKFKFKSAEILVTFVTNSYADVITNDTLTGLTTAVENSDLRIFLSHQPRSESIDAASAAAYDLFLAGHTHGGQITFLFPFKNLSPTLFETKFVNGSFLIGNMTLVMSRGLGMSLAPIRYNSTPEVILLRFKSRN